MTRLDEIEARAKAGPFAPDGEALTVEDVAWLIAQARRLHPTRAHAMSGDVWRDENGHDSYVAEVHVQNDGSRYVRWAVAVDQPAGITTEEASFVRVHTLVRSGDLVARVRKLEAALRAVVDSYEVLGGSAGDVSGEAIAAAEAALEDVDG